MNITSDGKYYIKTAFKEKIFQLNIIINALNFLRNQVCAYWWSG